MKRSQRLPAGFGLDYAGQSRQLRVEGSKFLGVFLLSGILIYLVLAAQFERFRDPFIGIMLVSGMIIGTVFTLFVVPSVYMLVACTRHAVAPAGATAAATESMGGLAEAASQGPDRRGRGRGLERRGDRSSAGGRVPLLLGHCSIAFHRGQVWNCELQFTIPDLTPACADSLYSCV